MFFFGFIFECMLIDDQQRMDFYFIIGRVFFYGVGFYGDFFIGVGVYYGGMGVGIRAGGVQFVIIL